MRTARLRGFPVGPRLVPSALLVVARSELVTPLPAVGLPVVTSGGHAEAHAPVHVLLAPVSACHRYRVRPWESIRMGPKLPLARSTVPDDALVEDGADDAGGPLAPVVVCLLELPLPHAATAIALKASAVAAASGARRLLRIVTPSMRWFACREKSRQRGSGLVKRSYGRAARGRICPTHALHKGVVSAC